MLVALAGPLLRVPFVRPWLEARSRCGGTPFVPTPSGGCGAQRRSGAAPLGAPGPQPRGPARTRRLAGSTGSMARTHPLTAVSTVAFTLAPPCAHLLPGFAVLSHGAADSVGLARRYAHAKASL